MPIALIFILLLQGNALVNGEGSPLRKESYANGVYDSKAYDPHRTPQQLLDDVMTCQYRKMDGRAIDCQSEIDRFNRATELEAGNI